MKNIIMNTGKIALLASAFCLIMSGCASSIAIQVQRTPNWKTAGIQRIAIMPIDSGIERLDKETADYLGMMLTSEIRSANHFTLIDPGEIIRRQKRGESIENYADALLNGKVSVNSKNDSHTIQVRDPATKEKADKIMFDRELTLSYTYSLSLSRDGSIIGVETKEGKASESKEDPKDLASSSQLMQRVITRSWLNSLIRNLVPYTVTENLVMALEKSKDKILKERMREANKMVKAKNYRTALNEYLDIYSAYGNFAAGYNASNLHEALGDIPSALTLLYQLEAETGNPQARSKISRLNRIQNDQAALASEYSKAYSRTDMLIARASDEIFTLLPQNAKVWIYANGKNEPTLAAAINDGISSALIKNGVTLVDREHARLIEMEQNFQMSGYVSDDDVVSIANAAGATILITVSVSGSGAVRRLQLQVIDIERRITLLRSDASEEWNL